MFYPIAGLVLIICAFVAWRIRNTIDTAGLGMLILMLTTLVAWIDFCALVLVANYDLFRVTITSPAPLGNYLYQLIIFVTGAATTWFFRHMFN